MHLKSLIILSMMLFLHGCKSVDDTMKQFIGHHYSVLAGNWGPPHSKVSDGNGGEVWIYQEARSYTTPGTATTSTNINAQATGQTYGNSYYNNPYASSSYNTTVNGSASGKSTTTYTPPQTHNYSAIRSFYINSDGIIYNYSWKGY